MLLTLFYMVATWVQSWRLSSLKTRLNAILQIPENIRPSIMLYTGVSLQNSREEIPENKGKLLNSNCIRKDFLSSLFCSNHNQAKLGDLLWYQGEKQLCTIYPKQNIDVSDWLLYPYGKTIFPLNSCNSAQTHLQENVKLHVLIEADLNKYVPLGYSKATKLEDYGYIVAWTADQHLGVIIETDLEHITKFSTNLMLEQCYINNGLMVTRIESVSVSGKPCICNYERFYSNENKKLHGNAQWHAFVRKLNLVSSTARLVSQQGEPTHIKEIPGLIVSPGSKPISLQMPVILEINVPSSDFGSKDCLSSVPSTPPPTPLNTITNTRISKFSNSAFTNSSVVLNSSFVDSVDSLDNLSTSRSQEFILEASSHEVTPKKSVKSLRIKESNLELDSILSSKSSLCNSSVNNGAAVQNGHISGKPPNILIYSDSAVAIDNIQTVLSTTLRENKYVVYPLSLDEAKSNIWMDQAKLVVVCGNIGRDMAAQFVEYIVRGGKLLALCSDILKTFLPTFKTAEVRENELVRFSYGKWKHVHMMHHVFCYQASPIRTKFSQDQDECRNVPATPSIASVFDREGRAHKFHVKVLGSEETWHTPSILLATLPNCEGKAVFSQIHLEADPSQYEFEENKFKALKQSNITRIEIFSDLLKSHLDIEVSKEPKIQPAYTLGFFLGRHELKLEMLKNLKAKMKDDILKTNTSFEMQFCQTPNILKPASSAFLPVMVHRCPENFSTVEYFENLGSEKLGRLVIYSDVLTSSLALLKGSTWQHGLAIISSIQTKGQGRAKNVWLSPKGCAMFSLQLHIPLKSFLGERVSLVQHLVAVSVVSSIKSLPGYQNIELKIKWPNDIYSKDLLKLGGVSVSTVLEPENAICNIGVGINLYNSNPTTCINDVIKKYNESHGAKLKQLTYEKFFARIFTKMEELYDRIQNGSVNDLYNLYYEYWIHNDVEVNVLFPNGKAETCQIQGIDEYGFLKVKGAKGQIHSVQPDGNSFDIFRGLISPKP